MSKKKKFHKYRDEIVIDIGNADIIIDLKGIHKGKKIKAKAIYKPKK